MNISFDIERLTPRFLFDDRNGHALAKAIEKAFHIAAEAAQNGIDIIQNPDRMPEWRLDEMAWEYNIPYEYTADVAVKREWIKSAYELSSLNGTPEGMYRYLKAYFDEPIVQENWVYGGDPFHFRTVFMGSWTPENLAWATRASNYVKNVRSILDGHTYRGDWPQNMFAGCALCNDGSGRFSVPAELIEDDWYTDEAGNMLMDEKSVMLTVEG